MSINQPNKMKKKCFKCNRYKKISLFYKHPATADGYLNKCKHCTKKDVRERYYDPESREKIREYEKKRFQDPERKKKIIEYQRKSRLKNPGVHRSRNKIKNALRDGKLVKEPCEVCGEKKSEAHHEDYRKPLDVRWLCFKHHREEHGQTF